MAEIEIEEGELLPDDDVQIGHGSLSPDLLQLLSEREALACDSLRSQISLLQQQMEVEKREASTIITSLKQELESNKTKTRELFTEKQNTDAECKQAKDKLCVAQSQYESLEKRLLQEFNVKSVDELFQTAQRLLEMKDELDAAKEMKRNMQIELSLEKHKNSTKLVSATKENEMIHQLQILSDQITDFKADAEYKSEEVAKLRNQLNKAMSENSKLTQELNEIKLKNSDLSYALTLENFKSNQMSAEIENLHNQIQSFVGEKVNLEKEFMKEKMDLTRRMKLISALGKHCDPAFASIDQSSALFPVFNAISTFLLCSGELTIDNDALNRAFTEMLNEARLVADRSRGRISAFTPSIRQLMDTIDKQRSTISELTEERNEFKEKSEYLEENDTAPQLSSCMKQLQRTKLENSSLKLENEQLRKLSYVSTYNAFSPNE